MKKTKFNKKELTIFKSIVKNRLKEENDQLKSLKTMISDHKSYKSKNKSDNDHDASITRNSEMLKSMKRRTLAKVKDLESALDRIKSNGSNID